LIIRNLEDNTIFSFERSFFKVFLTLMVIFSSFELKEENEITIKTKDTFLKNS